MTLLRRWRLPLILIFGVMAALALLLAVFPFQLCRGLVERSLRSHYQRPVSIGAIERLDAVSFAPHLRIRKLRIAQAAWAGAGDMATVETIDLRLPVLPLLIGRVQPREMRIDGLSATLVRSKDGRESWRTGKRESHRGGGGPSVIAIAHSRLRYIDHKRDRSFDAAIALDAQGFRLDGPGKVLGTPVRLTARGAPVKPGTWPVRADIVGPALTMHAAGTLDGPFRFGHLDATVEAHADNLKLLDAIVEAGLPATQPVRLTAQVRRDWPDWTVRQLRGTVGRSDIAGEATIRKRDGRHIIKGGLRSRAFDFDDLADATGRARAAEKQRRVGPRLFPDTAIDLDNVAQTDGTLRLHVDRLLWPGPSPFRSLDGTLKVDRSRVDIADLRLGLTHGTLHGGISIDQRSGPTTFSTDLRLDGARLADFAPDMGFDAPLRGRMKLSGPGKTVRAAIGRSSGHVSLVARDGVLPDKTARLLGQDLGGLFKGGPDQARLRCMVVRLDAKQGRAVAAPMLIDTSRAVSRAMGSIDLAGERLTLSATGLPKQDVKLRVGGAIMIGGTIKAPVVTLPDGKGAVGTLLKAVGDAIGGKPMPIAPDSDCNGLIAKAMGN